MTDFTETYKKARGSVVSLATDIGTGVASSSGFITRIQDKNYIITAAHAVLLDSAVWGMDAVVLADDGKDGCGLYRNSKQLNIPAGISAITFRFIAADQTKGVFIDNVEVRNSKGTVFKDDFNKSATFGSAWSQGPGGAWSIVKRKGKLFSGNAARSADLSGTVDEVSTLILEVTTEEASTLRFDYKIDCDAGFFVVGYCTAGNCDNRASGNILAYYGNEVHPLRVVGVDGKGDIAICLPADGTDLSKFTPLALVPDSRVIPIATPVATLGNPSAIDPQSISVGVIRDNKYSLPVPVNVESILTCNTDFAGDSGSPYVLVDGSVVGMLTFGVAGAGNGLGGGPSSRILNRVLGSLVPQLQESGYVEFRKAYLGLDMVGIDLSVIDQLNLPMKGTDPAVVPSGFIVLAVESDSPLANVIGQLDIILTLGESSKPASVKTMGLFPGQSGPSEVTWFMNPTGKVDMTVLRFDQSQGVWDTVKVSNAPLQSFPVAKDIPLGFTMSLKGPSMTTAAFHPKTKAVVTMNKKNGDGLGIRRQYTMNRYI